jgi:hypothetical protein
MLGGSLAVLQAPGLQCFLFDPFSFQQDGLATSEALSEQTRLLCQNVRTGLRGHWFSCIFLSRTERFDGRSKYLEFCSDNAISRP